MRYIRSIILNYTILHYTTLHYIHNIPYNTGYIYYTQLQLMLVKNF